MSGGRKPMDVNLAKKGKHWTKAEIETRKSQEVSVETRLLPPSGWALRQRSFSRLTVSS